MVLSVPHLAAGRSLCIGLFFFRRKPADQFFLFFFFGALLLGFVFSENSCQSAFFSGDNLPISLFFGDKLPISLLFFRKTDPHQYVFRENLTLPVGGIPATLCLQETPPHSMAFSCKVLCLRPPPRPSPTRSDLSLGPPLPPSVAYSCNMLVWDPPPVLGPPPPPRFGTPPPALGQCGGSYFDSCCAVLVYGLA